MFGLVLVKLVNVIIFFTFHCDLVDKTLNTMIIMYGFVCMINAVRYAAFACGLVVCLQLKGDFVYL